MHHVHHGRESSSHPGRAQRVSESPCWCGNRRHHLWLLESLHLNGSWRNWVDFTKQRKGTRFPADMISRGNAANESWWILVCHGISDTLSSSWNCNLSSIELQFCHDLNIATSWDILAQMMTAIIIIYNSPRKSPGSALRNSILVLGIPEPKGTTWRNSEMSCSSKPAVRQGAPGTSLPFLDVHLFTPDLHYTSLCYDPGWPGWPKGTRTGWVPALLKVSFQEVAQRSQYLATQSTMLIHVAPMEC